MATPRRPRPAPARSVAPGAPQRVRIIGGQWRSRLLPVTQRHGLRPTPDRVRETLFNWLGQDLSGWHCIDAFAGTGALGFEAASRGAAQVLLIEQDAQLVRQLAAIARQLPAPNVQIRHGDAVQQLQTLPACSADLMFIDPPFDSPALFVPALSAAARLLHPQGFVYLEAPEAWDTASLGGTGLQCLRHLHASTVHAHLLNLTDA